MLPCKATDYTPQVQAEVQSTLTRKRQTAKTYYDRHIKPLPDLTIGQPVGGKATHKSLTATGNLGRSLAKKDHAVTGSK